MTLTEAVHIVRLQSIGAARRTTWHPHVDPMLHAVATWRVHQPQQFHELAALMGFGRPVNKTHRAESDVQRPRVCIEASLREGGLWTRHELARACQCTVGHVGVIVTRLRAAGMPIETRRPFGEDTPHYRYDKRGAAA